MQETALPTYKTFLVPILQVLDEAAGSLTKREIDAAVIERAGVTEEQLAVEYPAEATARGSKVLHRIAFARSDLKLCGAVDNSARGVWTLLPVGRDLLAAGPDAVLQADAQMHKQLALARAGRAPAAAPKAGTTDEELQDHLIAAEVPSGDNWRGTLLSALKNMAPSSFERLCAQLLREAGCEEVTVTRYVGDEGLDGVGILRIGLLSFPVYFQAKRYGGTVGPEKVRELRGALSGRADKGILLTTGRFTPAALSEASRAGAPIDLIDGERLCDLLLQYEIGVRMSPVVDETNLRRFDS